MKIVFPPITKKYVKLHCQGKFRRYETCQEVWPVLKMLKNMNPKNVLEIGAGLGRVSVYLNHNCDWNNTRFYLLDGNSGEKIFNNVHKTDSKKHFYNSLKATKSYCSANGIPKDNLTLLNAENDDWKSISVKFDLCYSFFAIGFHWPITGYLERIYPMLNKNAKLIFQIRKFRNQRMANFNCKQIMNIDNKKYKFIHLCYEESILILERI